jgi:6-phosphogluconolactonase
MNFIEYADAELLWMALAQDIAGALNRGLMNHERVSMAVPGGTTPGPLFDALSSLKLDWERVDVLLSDERWVPETSPRSNTRLLRQRLFVDYAAAAHLVPLHGDAETPEELLPVLSDGVRAVLPLSVALLGMGEDMHTASMFPGADNLSLALSSNAPALVAMRAPGAPEPRITLSAPVINGAMQKHLVITGDAKREALERAEALRDPVKGPIYAVMDGLNVHWARE